MLTLFEGAQLCNDIAAGKFDAQLQKLGAYLAQYPNVKYLFRIDYEVSRNIHANTDPSNFNQNTFDLTAYPKAFAHVRSVISSAARNVQFVYHAVRGEATYIYPGDEQVDLIGFSIFNNDVCLPDGTVNGCTSGVADPNLQRDMEWAPKPKIVAESAVQTPSSSSGDGFTHYLDLVKNLIESQGVVGWTYINSNWPVHGWTPEYWGDSRIEANPAALDWFKQNIAGNPRYTFG